MHCITALVALASAVQAAAIHGEGKRDDVVASTPVVNTTNVFAPVLLPGVDTNNLVHVVPATNVTLFYASNTTTDASVHVNNTMRYPTVLLEQIAAISNVDCTSETVAVTFNDSTVFEVTQAAWNAEGIFVLITNHLGDCDAELERGYFLVSALTFDNSTLLVTAASAQTNISATAATTEISFGNVPTGNVAKRSLVLDPTYTLSTELSIPAGTNIYSYAPYLTVTADQATFTANVTFSGYLAYDWLTWKVSSLYFDIDTDFSATVGISVAAEIEYNTTFTYSPPSLYYGVSVAGLIELGPELVFAVDAYIATSETVNATTEVTIALADGNAHLDLLTSGKSSTSGWTPSYNASASVFSQTEAQINPAASLTVEIAVNFFGGLLDLSTGITAKPEFDNSFILNAGETVNGTGVTGYNATGACDQGIELKSDFVFAIDAFATEWYNVELYKVTVPILDKCYSWA